MIGWSKTFLGISRTSCKVRSPSLVTGQSKSLRQETMKYPCDVGQLKQILELILENMAGFNFTEARLRVADIDTRYADS